MSIRRMSLGAGYRYLMSSVARMDEAGPAAGLTGYYAAGLVSREVAETLAPETGAKVAVLDPVEGLTSQSAGRDYLEVMEANLRSLRAGQRCT